MIRNSFSFTAACDAIGRAAGRAAGRAFPALLHWCRLPGLISWAAVSLGTWCGFLLPWGLVPALQGRGIVVSLAAGLGIAGILVRVRVVRFSAFFLFAFLVCGMHRAKQVDVYECIRAGTAGRQTLAVTGKVCSAPLPHYENFHFLLKVDSIEGLGSQKLRGITLNCISPEEPPLYGSVVARGVFSPPRLRRNPFEYDEYASMMAQGVWGSLDAFSCETIAVRRALFERLGAWARNVAIAALRKVKNYDNRALLQASFLGDTEFLSPYIKDTFRKAGIYHLIAISGLNTAMLVIALYFFLRFFPVSRTAAHLICVAALWAYLPFVGMIPSLFRATIMATLIIAALLFEKKSYPLHTLGLAGTLWLLLSPESLFGPGYQLSFAATAGLLLLVPVLNRFMPKGEGAVAGKTVSFIFSSLFISIASFLATAPVLLYHFGTISYFGLFANLVAVITMTFAMWAFFAGLFFQMVAPFFAAIPLWVAERFLDVVVWTGGLADYFPWSQASYPSPWPEMIIVAAVALAGCAAVNPALLKRYGIVAITALALFMPADWMLRAARTDLKAVRFAVPGIQATGIRWPDGSSWLVAGDAKRLTARVFDMHVVPWLRHLGKSRFDALLLSSENAGDTAALRAEFSALTRASIRVYASPGASYVPCDRCTCAIDMTDSMTRVTLGSSGVTAAVEMKTRGMRSKRRKNRADPPSSGGVSALVLRLEGRRVWSEETVPAGHPLR